MFIIIVSIQTPAGKKTGQPRSLALLDYLAGRVEIFKKIDLARFVTRKTSPRRLGNDESPSNPILIRHGSGRKGLPCRQLNCAGNPDPRPPIVLLWPANLRRLCPRAQARRHDASRTAASHLYRYCCMRFPCARPDSSRGSCSPHVCEFQTSVGSSC
jgi:hypothetical protein